jgi:hypothetical protein
MGSYRECPWREFAVEQRRHSCGPDPGQGSVVPHATGNVDPDELSPIQPDDDEGIEQVEANGWHNKQVHGRNVRCVITQKRAPSLTWRSTALDHVLGNARLCDVKSKLELFAVDAWRAP